MLFNSSIFLFVFLPIVYLVFWHLTSKRARYIWLAGTGYVFYGYWNPAFCLLMLFSTLVSYTAGLGFLRASTARQRKVLLIAPIAVDLMLLAYFKYADFAISILNAINDVYGGTDLPMLKILLPVGISFYTFHTITYIVDSYRGVITPTRNFFEFASYVSLFSQLVAGPIVRFRELEEDLENIDGKDRRQYLDAAWSFFVIGLIQKVLIADTIAAVINPALEHARDLSSTSAWLCMLGYTYQLYFDFAGYSNMAVGLGFLFGMNIPQNFDAPYKALNPSDFWRRWHISLSRCLRDYLYIVMGGNRGSELRTYRNVFLTMLIGGLWHGAAWTFVIWGAYHGLLLALYRRFATVWDARPQWLQRACMFLLAIIGWTMFRADTWPDATALLGSMFMPTAGIDVTGTAALLVMITISAAVAHLGPTTFQMTHRWKPQTSFALAALFLLCVMRINGPETSPFLYFQF